ncbi:AroM family protein [Candidatus Bathyarchaeota archaeon]|nr:AroM family protein [Candidatus Bathyarchaeota archaeon]
MTKIGMLTIGQTPRVDLLPALIEILGDEYEIVEAGALDGLSLEDVKGIEILPDDYVLVSRMRDGTEVKITKRFVIPRVQEKITELEEKSVRLTVIMCTGAFPQYESKGLVVTPQEILKGVLNGSLKKGRLGVVYPTEEQMPGAQSNFGSTDVETYADATSPYEGSEELEALAERLSAQNLDLILLNCFGFSSDLKKYIAERTGVPTIQSNAVVARVLKELAI